jgi:hypothetical protein
MCSRQAGESVTINERVAGGCFQHLAESTLRFGRASTPQGAWIGGDARFSGRQTQASGIRRHIPSRLSSSAGIEWGKVGGYLMIWHFENGH